jgi:hypothetical protein
MGNCHEITLAAETTEGTERDDHAHTRLTGNQRGQETG